MPFTGLEKLTGQGANSPYLNFKTPFFNLEVATSKPPFIKLPVQLLKLVQSIELLETSAKCTEFDQLVIKFTEGSREPYNLDETTTAYDGQGFELSNNTGMVTDLQFSSIGGITALAQDLFSSSSITSSSASEISTVSAEEVVNSSKTALNAGLSLGSKSSKYLFSQNHLVRLTWGYLEDVESVRSWVGSIKIIRTQFPASGQPVTEITAHGSGSSLDEVAPRTAKVYGTNIGVSFLGKTVSQIVKEVASDAGFEVYISEDFGDEEKPDSDYPFTWPAGMSMHQFLGRLAGHVNCVYRPIFDAAEGKPTIQFIKRTEWLKHIFLPEYLFTYKGPNSILMSVDVKADFGNISHNHKKQIKSDGTIVTNEGEETEQVKLFEKEESASNIPGESIGADTAAGNVKNAATNNAVTGNVEYTPYNDSSAAKGKADAASGCAASHNLIVEFSCLGYPKLTTGVLPIRGIGERYSGNFEVFKITHTIDNSGYKCKGSGKKVGIGSGDKGSGSPFPTANSNDTKGTKTTTQMFDALSINTESEDSGGIVPSLLE